MAIQWRVLYKDGTIEEGYDNLSKQAFQNPNVVYFSLFVNNSRYSIDLENGTVSLNHIDIKSPFFSAQYRLIYYNICSQTLPSPTEFTITPHIGWQTTINNRNYKVIYGITPLNEVIMVFD
jgi:hypothetical protein